MSTKTQYVLYKDKQISLADWGCTEIKLARNGLENGRNLYRRVTLAEIGFDYYGIGMGENIAEKA